MVIDHVDPGEARRTTGRWSEWNDPLTIEAQVEYGVDPEGSEDGGSHNVRVTVSETEAVRPADRKWFECQPEDGGRCESEDVDGDAVVYRWFPGAVEDPATYSVMVVRADEVVRVAYDTTDEFGADPRSLELPVAVQDLWAAALDPAMSLRTTPEAWRSGEGLDHYQGMEEPPDKPESRATTPRRLAAVVARYGGIQPDAVRRSRLTDFGADAVGAHLEFSAGQDYDPFTVDILTTVGRVPQIDPLPCPVQKSAQAADRACFAWDRDTAVTWTLASGDRPGVLWIVGAQYDDAFNRVESVGLRIESTGIVAPYFTEAGDANRLPPDWFGSVYPLTADLGVGPQTQVEQ